MHSIFVFTFHFGHILPLLVTGYRSLYSLAEKYIQMHVKFACCAFCMLCWSSGFISYTGTPSQCQIIWIQIRPLILSKTNCYSYQQTIKFDILAVAGRANKVLFGIYHTGQCKRTSGCYNELVVAFFSTGGGVKGKKIYTC